MYIRTLLAAALAAGIILPGVIGCEDEDHDYHHHDHDRRVIIEHDRHEGPAAYRVGPEHHDRDWDHR